MRLELMANDGGLGIMSHLRKADVLVMHDRQLVELVERCKSRMIFWGRVHLAKWTVR